MARFADRLKAAPVMLTDGGIETRLIYEFRQPCPISRRSCRCSIPTDDRRWPPSIAAT